MSTLEGETTRSFASQYIPVNSTVWVWADQINASDGIRMDYFKSWKRIADGAGALNGSGQRLFPATNPLNFFALKGNFTTTITENVSELPVYDTEKELDGIIHQVSDDQTTSVEFYKSDLLYSQLKNQTATNSVVRLPFYHMLSRVQIVLIPGHGGTNNNLLSTSDLEDAVVTILDVKNKVKFSADTTKLISNRDNREAMLTVPATDNDASTIVVKTETSTEEDLKDTSYGDAIVVPKQTFAAGADFIKVEYMGNTTYFRLAEALTLESGKQYRFKLYIDRIGGTYTVRPAIADWTAVDGGTKWVE